MERKLASIQIIKEINLIPDADAIDRATILGWQCVVKKGEFKVGDLCVYCEVDSLLPIKPEFEFLRKSCFNSRLNGFRIKTMKLRGQISQGIAFPLSVLPPTLQIFPPVEDSDVSIVLEVRKYEVPIPVCLGGEVSGNFPSFIPKTDETRIQSVLNVLNRHHGVPFTVTEKLDGTSSTFYIKEGTFGVCGRNWEFKPGVENVYWEIAKKYDLENKMKALGAGDFAIQGEIVGPGIQKNKYALSEHKLFIYHAFDILSHTYYYQIGVENVCYYLGVPMVPVLERNFFLNEKMRSVEEAVNFSSGLSVINKNIQREGIVVKSALEMTDPELGRLSFKVVNPNFLLKYEKDEE
jgi:RNA ligase (TIGR02306 family)